MLKIIAMIALLSLAPTLLFLGFCRLLKHGQRTTLVANTQNRTNGDTSVISLKQATTSVIQTGKLVPDTPTQTHQPTGCPNCGTSNADYTKYCKNCSQKH